MGVKIRRQQGAEEQIGDVKHSILSEPQFQLLHGPTWVMVKGQSIAGSDLAVEFGIASLPDGRGVFIRGKNNGRSDGNQNPDGDLALGAFQNHGNASHNHGGATGSHGHGVSDPGHQHSNASAGSAGQIGGGPFLCIQSTQGQAKNVLVAAEVTGISVAANTASISSDGTNETRPKSITLNTFIKINR